MCGCYPLGWAETWSWGMLVMRYYLVIGTVIDGKAWSPFYVIDGWKQAATDLVSTQLANSAARCTAKHALYPSNCHVCKLSLCKLSQ
jgi:hypothetical protein